MISNFESKMNLQNTRNNLYDVVLDYFNKEVGIGSKIGKQNYSFDFKGFNGDFNYTVPFLLKDEFIALGYDSRVSTWKNDGLVEINSPEEMNDNTCVLFLDIKI